MTSFIDFTAVEAASSLKSAHYRFPRTKELHDALAWCVTDYYAKAMSGREYEARGLLVTGRSRVGKTREIQRLLSKFNQSATVMPDGRPARFINCTLSGRMTWKDLGMKTLTALGYPAAGRRTQNSIWDMVLDQAKRQGVVGIHYDECQHMFSDTGTANNRVVLDSFKALLKDPRWPLVLILSGVPDLAKHIERDTASEERKQLRYLLRPIHFDVIDPSKDLEELNSLAFSFADKVGLQFDSLSTLDFLKRLSHASSYRWGLAIELMIEAFIITKQSSGLEVTTKQFSKAFSLIHGLPNGFSPFDVDDYEETFDEERLLRLLDRSD
ncbi:ATP-binding protein [Paracoccus hibiscisoli]|uniref:ATP-binding protein n=1 Tax=Paracoccus hibiscisoli TaxID=2023261 RepID=UPI0023F09B35|nr:ATP-binding protein [Paracoccus hibiscisoli]